MISTKFWSDPWVMTKLNSLDRLLFLYLISNELTNISGIYEISEHRIAFDTGIERDTLVKAMIPRLEPKVYFKDNWVILVNFTKHQNLKSQDVILGIKREFEMAPKAVQKEAMIRGWGEGLGMVPDTKPNLTKPTVGDKSPHIEIVSDSEREDHPKKETRSKDKEAIYKLFSSKEQPWWRHKQQKIAALSLFDLIGIEKVKRGLELMCEHADDKYCPQAATPFQYEEQLPKLTAYIKRNGL